MPARYIERMALWEEEEGANWPFSFSLSVCLSRNRGSWSPRATACLPAWNLVNELLMPTRSRVLFLREISIRLKCYETRAYYASRGTSGRSGIVSHDAACGKSTARRLIVWSDNRLARCQLIRIAVKSRYAKRGTSDTGRYSSPARGIRRFGFLCDQITPPPGGGGLGEGWRRVIDKASPFRR